MRLSQKLRFYRTSEGYTQYFVASQLGLERSTYTYYESGKTSPDPYALLTLSRLYGVTMEVLVDENIEPAGAQEFLAEDRKYRRGTRKTATNPANREYHKKNAKKKKEPDEPTP